MKNRKLFLLVGLVLIAGLVLSSCATNVATPKPTTFTTRSINNVGDPKYTVLGPVTLDKDWRGVLGFTTPTVTLPIFGTIPSADNYLWQSGGVTYVDILNKAREQYPTADAVIDIQMDYNKSQYWVFYASRKNIVSGIAIRYTRSEVDYPPPDSQLRLRMN